MDTRKIEDPLLVLIRDAGGQALSLWNHNLRIERKADRTYVTSADMHIHELLTQRLRSIVDIPVVSEEAPCHSIPESCWLIDPIDGTSSYVAGLPTWSISIALIWERTIIYGCIYFPAFDRLIHSGMGDSILHTSDTHFGIDEEEYITIFSTFHRRYRTTYPGKIRSLGSCTSSVVYSITGSSKLAFVGRVKLWDIAACLPLVNEAGGVVMTVDAKAFSIDSLYDTPETSTPPLLVGNRKNIKAFLKNYVTRL